MGKIRKLCKYQANQNFMETVLEAGFRIIYSTLMQSNQWKEQNVSLLLHLKFANEIHVISAYEGFIYDSQMIVPISVSKQCGINCLYGLMMYSEFMNWKNCKIKALKDNWIAIKWYAYSI